MDLGLEGKVVLATGGSDGLGRALCHELVAEGAKWRSAAATPSGSIRWQRRWRRRWRRAGRQSGRHRARGPLSFRRCRRGEMGRIDGLVTTPVPPRPCRWQRLSTPTGTRISNSRSTGSAADPLRSADLRQSGGAIVNTLAIGPRHRAAALLRPRCLGPPGWRLTKVLSKESGRTGSVSMRCSLA